MLMNIAIMQKTAYYLPIYTERISRNVVRWFNIGSTITPTARGKTDNVIAKVNMKEDGSKILILSSFS